MYTIIPIIIIIENKQKFQNKQGQEHILLSPSNKKTFDPNQTQEQIKQNNYRHSDSPDTPNPSQSQI